MKLSRSEHPKISIITPSYNQGQYLEQTINSVLNQDYPHLEYIIIDGGSSDNSVEIIKKYQKFINYWISEKDKGQSDAINKGLTKATGDVINWLNSDDYYMPGALKHVAEIFESPKVTAYSGRSRVFSKTSERFSSGTDIYHDNLAKTIGWARIDQPETFFHRKAWDALGSINTDFHYVMDKEFWIRYLFRFGLDGAFKDDQVLVNFRIHEQSKTGSQLASFNAETFALYYSLSLAYKLDIAKAFEVLAHTAPKSLFKYEQIDKSLLEKAVNYFLQYVALEAYAQNNYGLAKQASAFVDYSLLDLQDQGDLKKILRRMKWLPIFLKKAINTITGN